MACFGGLGQTSRTGRETKMGRSTQRQVEVEGKHTERLGRKTEGTVVERQKEEVYFVLYCNWL